MGCAIPNYEHPFHERVKLTQQLSAHSIQISSTTYLKQFFFSFVVLYATYVTSNNLFGQDGETLTSESLKVAVVLM